MSDLDRLGKRHQKLLAELAELKEPLQAAMRAARVEGVTYAALVERTGYRTIQQVREICMTDKQREEERAKRRRKSGGSTA